MDGVKSISQGGEDGYILCVMNGQIGVKLSIGCNTIDTPGIVRSSSGVFEAENAIKRDQQSGHFLSYSTYSLERSATLLNAPGVLWLKSEAQKR